MWMKNTYIPLDMLFIDSHGRIVCLLANTTPQSLEILSCPKPVMAVLEIGGGEAARPRHPRGQSSQLQAAAGRKRLVSQARRRGNLSRVISSEAGVDGAMESMQDSTRRSGGARADAAGDRTERDLVVVPGVCGHCHRQVALRPARGPGVSRVSPRPPGCVVKLRRRRCLVPVRFRCFHATVHCPGGMIGYYYGTGGSYAPSKAEASYRGTPL